MKSASIPIPNDSKQASIDILPRLPNELATQALSYLNLKDTNAAAKVNKEYQSLSKDNFIWFNLHTPNKTNYDSKIDYQILVKDKVEKEKIQSLRRNFTYLANHMHRTYNQNQMGKYSLFFYQLEQNLLEVSAQNNNILAGALFFIEQEYEKYYSSNVPSRLLTIYLNYSGRRSSSQFFDDIRHYCNLIPKDTFQCLYDLFQYINHLPPHSHNALGTREELLMDIIKVFTVNEREKIVTQLLKAPSAPKTLRPS